jgi:acyl-CoA thioesterase FadM
MGIDPPRFMYTARLEVRYRKNVPIGKPLRIVGRAEKSKGRTATATAAIYDQDGAILAEADALLVDVPTEVLGTVDLQSLGWRVYDDDGAGE